MVLVVTVPSTEGSRLDQGSLFLVELAPYGQIMFSGMCTSVKINMNISQTTKKVDISAVQS
jgi:hypothetical protein